MSDLTKNALAESLINLCDEKRLNKITVQDIVDKCGVNRNTFYYHFADIYDLLEYIFVREEENLFSAIKSIDDLTMNIDSVIKSINKFRKLIINVYNSLNREQLEKYLLNVIGGVLRKFARQHYDTTNVKKENLEFAINFFDHAMVGMILEWIGKGMTDDALDLGMKLRKMCDGAVEVALNNLSK